VCEHNYAKVQYYHFGKGLFSISVRKVRLLTCLGEKVSEILVECAICLGLHVKVNTLFRITPTKIQAQSLVLKDNSQDDNTRLKPHKLFLQGYNTKLYKTKLDFVSFG